MGHNTKNYMKNGGQEWVIGGKLTVEDEAEVQGLGGASSWDDLEDKPFGVSEQRFPAFHENTISGAKSQSQKLMTYDTIKLAQKYVVVFDGVEYECVPVDNGGTRTLGASDSTCKEYPFYIVYDSSDFDDAWHYWCADDAAHTLKIFRIDETVVTLDAKYLPKAARVTAASGDTVTATQFNSLLTALKNAGYMQL